MALIRICDVCRKRIYGNDGKKYRFQERVRRGGWFEPSSVGWEEVDVCDECADMFRRVTEEREIKLP